MNYSSAFHFEYQRENESFFDTQASAEAEGIEYLLQPIRNGFGSLRLLSLTQPLHGCIEDSDAVSRRNCDTSPGGGDPKYVELVSDERPAQSAETASSSSTPNFMVVDSVNHSDEYRVNADHSSRWFDFNKFMEEAILDEQPWDRQEQEKQNDPAAQREEIGKQSEETSLLISAASVSPPSEGQPATPKEIERSNSKEVPLASRHKAKQKPQASEYAIRKRKLDGQCHDLGDSGKEIAFDRMARLIGEDASGEPERDIKATRSLTLSTDFIVHRFGISPAHDVSRRWRCPFPTSEALPDGRCLATFGVHTIRSHIIDHVNHHNSIRPQEPVQCPFHSQECCKWTAVAGANREFPRHVAEVHLRINAATCSCGTSLSRGKRDQIIRHLRRGHQENLEKKRKTDPITPAFVDVEDPQLVEEEWQWRERMRGNGNVDKGEGSSDGRIKRRRFF